MRGKQFKNWLTSCSEATVPLFKFLSVTFTQTQTFSNFLSHKDTHKQSEHARTRVRERGRAQAGERMRYAREPEPERKGEIRVNCVCECA